MPRRQQETQEVPGGRAEVVVRGNERLLSGPLASLSDFILSISTPAVLMGSLASASLLGYQVGQRADELRELTELPLLLYRSGYSPGAAYQLLDALGPQGRAEYQYLNALATGVFPLLVALFLAALLGRTFDRARLPREWNLLPFIPALAATAESLGVAWLLHTFPAVHVSVAAALGFLSSLKTRFLWYSLAALLLGTAWLGKVLVQERLARKRR